MNLYEAQDFFKNMFPGKEIKFEFDQNCHRFCECVMTDGKPNIMHHVEYQKVKVTVDGMPAQYIPIAPHRMTVSWKDMKQFLSNQNDVHMTDSECKVFSELSSDEYEKKMSEWMNWSGLQRADIEKKISAYKNK